MILLVIFYTVLVGCMGLIDHLMRKRLRHFHNEETRLHKELIASYEGLLAAKNDVIGKQDYLITEQRKALSFFAARERELYDFTNPSPPEKETMQ